MLWWQRRCSLHRLRRACRRREASLHASATPAVIFALHDRFERAFADGARSADAEEVNALLDRYAGILIARQAIVHAIRDAKGGRAAPAELLALRCFDHEVALLAARIRARCQARLPQCRWLPRTSRA